MEDNLTEFDIEDDAPAKSDGKILCIGEALIDMICTDKGSTLSSGNNFLKKPGGAPTNVAAAIAALGGKVELAAKVGNDPFGKQLIEVMQSFGVSTKWMLQDNNYFTTFAFVSLMLDGERDFVFNRGADGELSRAEIETIDLDEFSIIHFGSATGFLPGPLQAAYQGMLQRALQKSMFISFDPNYRHLLFKNNVQAFIDQSWNFLESCNFFKVSDEEAILITGAATLSDAVKTLLKKTSGVFTITLGKEGTMFGINGETVIIPSIHVNVVDTTGAGDAFVGAVLYQLSALQEDLNNISFDNWKNIISNANKAGARTCEYLGAMEAFKHLSSKILVKFALMDINDIITIDKDILSGQPVFKGTRVPVESLFDHLEAGVSLDEFLDDFPTVSKAQATALLGVANKLLTSKNAAQLYATLA